MFLREIINRNLLNYLIRETFKSNGNMQVPNAFIKLLIEIYLITQLKFCY